MAPIQPDRRPRSQTARPASRPWRDRSGRLSWLKLGNLVLTVAPGAWIAFALLDHQLGAQPVMEAVHQTGFWAVRFLILSLLVTPLRTLFNWQRVMLVRRQLGLAALFYTMAHVTLYAADENWRMVTVAHEILARFYLEVGLVALTGLAVLGVYSTDATLRRMGKAWKRLHRTVYGITALGLFHFFLQAKINAGEASLMAGLFIWLMVWRALPAGPDRKPWAVLALAVLAAVATLGLEAAWYGLATNVGARRPVAAEFDISFGPHPAGQVLLICLCLAVVVTLFWAQRWRRSPAFHMALYAGGALMVVFLAFAFSLTDDWLPDDWLFWDAAGWFVAGAGVIGLIRWLLPAAAVRSRQILDAACLAGLAAPLVVGLVS